MDEFERIREIERRLGGQWGSVRIGIGDDAAVLEPSSLPTVLSVDSAVEGVHFEWWLADARALGRRATVAALSDLAAMGATPSALLSALMLPESVDDATLLALVDGIADAAREVGAPVVGGNLSSAAITSITTTVVGTLEGAALTRSGARAGDAIFVSGPLGGSALGLQQLLADPQSRPTEGSPFVTRFVRPIARIEQGRELAGIASAAIDISDGLLQDLGHVCRASGVGARIELERVPLQDGLVRAAEALGLDAVQLALTGGEDFELLYTAPTTAAVEGTRIGEVIDGHDVSVVDADGHAVEITRRGYRHFEPDGGERGHSKTAKV